MPRKPGAKAIVCHGNKILLVLRDDNPNIAYPNIWNMPGGGIDEGETPAEAMARELMEEVNLTAADIIDVGSTTYEDGSIVYRFFVPVSDVQLQEIRLVSEGQRIDWFTFEEALKLEITPHFRAYLEVFEDDIRQLFGGKRAYILRHETLEIK